MIKNIEEVSCAFLHNVDLLCFSHLRWGFVFQRPNHLLSRFSKHQRVFFIEEPIFVNGDERTHIENYNDNLYVITPHLKHGLSAEEVEKRLQKTITSLVLQMQIKRYFSWYYTPMALPFTEHLNPELVVYDCMDELSAFKFAPADITQREKQLFSKADVVFTGGHSIYEHKKDAHHNIHPFPSSIDKHHFGQARKIKADPQDQSHIPHPRFGFFGVIDERFDIEMIDAVAKAKPDWHFVLLGPIVKIDPASLPHYDNIHYLGGKNYNELPSYIGGWDVAIIPFAMNESTRFISPTKTPEYLAAGKPVISTPIRDVVSPYGNNGLVHIVRNAEEFIAAGETELAKKRKSVWQKKVDEFLQGNSWDRTWSQMVRLIEQTLSQRTSVLKTGTEQKAYV
ncbi:glycosyltransferase family 1 protein [Flavisolibacter ginsenosidimutans]|uniref:Glycosyltransferase family 1 protein n=1 Tax=Flavisolibacter ginsenosidimutans TaxID=661481 RepID=A0A5B8UF71_9BACT|nr:glycosyltransferase family 1 protein [Flavisolibacter ginsenosidimutans]QEC55214.1 glycosyltransferase family 1 protein [Flavisolibacter ginsenosidimutans]